MLHLIGIIGWFIAGIQLGQLKMRNKVRQFARIHNAGIYEKHGDDMNDYLTGLVTGVNVLVKEVTE